MKVRCAWHKENFGFVLFLPDKPPFEDHGVTDTICPECYNIVMKVADRGVEQRTAHRPHKPEVVGSNPTSATKGEEVRQ